MDRSKGRLGRKAWPAERTAKLRELYAAKVYSYVEMAEVLGVSKNSVAGRIGRLRAAEKRRRAQAGEANVALPRKPRKPYSLRFRPIKKAPHSHPLFRMIIALMNEHQISRGELCKRVGMSTTTFDNARTRTVPELQIMEAMFNVFGKTLQPVDMKDD